MDTRPIYFDGRHSSSNISDLVYVKARDGVVLDFHAGPKSGTIVLANTPEVREALLLLLAQAEAMPDFALSICAREHNGTDGLTLHLKPVK
jgi:hypothetical protein